MRERLPIPVREILRDAYEGRRLEPHIRPRRQRRRAWAPFAAAAALAAAAGIVLFVRTAPGDRPSPSAAPAVEPLDPEPLRLASGELPTTLTADAEPFVLSDGSAIALASGARLVTLQNDGEEFVTAADGRVTFDVRPGGPRRWTIDCALATVVVLGTRFTIDRDPERLVVSVERGLVLVRGERVPEGARRLGAGESIELRIHRGETRTEVVEEPPPASVERAPVARARWRDEAERGAWTAAYGALGEGGVSAIAPRASVEDLLLLADIARLSGHPAESVAPLERVLGQFPRDPNAPLAAFSLGRVHADALRDPASAASAFETALALGVPRALRADVLARLALSRRELGDAAGAARAAEEYLEESPEGAQAGTMRQLMGTP